MSSIALYLFGVGKLLKSKSKHLNFWSHKHVLCGSRLRGDDLKVISLENYQCIVYSSFGTVLLTKKKIRKTDRRKEKEKGKKW